MIQPTTGRVVHYFRDRDSEAQAALIAHVNQDGTVNLAVFDHNGNPEPRASGITLVQDGDPLPLQGHYCAWMAYQLGQAAKTEAVLAASQPGLRPGETSFQNENTGFGGVFAGIPTQADINRVTALPTVLIRIDDEVPVLNQVVDQGGASGDWTGVHVTGTTAPLTLPTGLTAADPSAYEGLLKTKHYTDGTSATGTAPLPDLSPAQQDEATRSTALDFADSSSGFSNNTSADDGGAYTGSSDSGSSSSSSSD